MCPFYTTNTQTTGDVNVDQDICIESEMLWGFQLVLSPCLLGIRSRMIDLKHNPSHKRRLN